MIVYKYRRWCVDEGIWVYILSEDGENAPTTCPNDPSHTLSPDPSKISIVDTAGGDEVSVKELAEAPREIDNRPIVIVSPARIGSFTWHSSRGDDDSPTPPDTGRGEGDQIRLSFSTPGYDEQIIHHNEPFEINGGVCYWGPDGSSWGWDDKWSISVRMPQTPMPTPGGTQNCTLQDLGDGGPYIILPANPGEGTHEVNLETAVPIPNGYSPKAKSGTGYWDVDRYWSEAISAADEFGKGEFNLYTVSTEMFFCKNIDCADPRRVWDEKADEAEWISSKWNLVFSATRVSSGAGDIGGRLRTYRPGAD